jgi:hypothetical protein
MALLSFALAVALTGSIYMAPLPQIVDASRVDARCNNSSSDAATINSAIISSSSGDEIVIQGTCSISSVIKLLGNRSYRGESRTGTVLKQANGANLDGIFASDSYLNNSAQTGLPVSIRQLTINGNSANNPSSATDGIILRSWQSVVEDVQIQDMGGNGILLTNKSANGTNLSNTQVNGQINGNFITGSGNHGIYVQDTGNSITDWQLMNNWIASSGADAIHMDNAAGWNVERNHIYGVPRNAIYANRLFGTSIADNYIEGFGSSSTTGTYHGILAKVQGNVGSQISGNKVFNRESNAASTYRYISVTVNYDTAVVAVTGNVIRSKDVSTGTGLYYDGGSNSLIVTSTGNVVQNVNTPKTVGTGVTSSSGI